MRFKLFVVLFPLLISNSFAADDGAAQILKYDFQRNGDGRYNYNFETSNGIKRNETGDQTPSIHDANDNAAFVRGSFEYTGADGVVYTVNYVADEAGFHPEGAHLKIPPFTPWMVGQPIDDGQYREDNSGSYKEDNSGEYNPEEGERLLSPALKPKEVQQNYISGERILNTFRTTPQPPITPITQEYLPTREPQKTNYVTGESILDTYLKAKSLPTTKYLPASSTVKNYISGENILDTFRESSKVTPKYLPSTSENNLYSSENPLKNDIIKSAFFNKPTPHPDILLHSTPNDRQTKIASLGLDKPFGEATQNKPTFAKLPQNGKGARRARGTKKFHYKDSDRE